MKKIIDRLIEYIEFKDISLNAFDKSVGASNGYIGKQIKNKASIGGNIIEKISSVYTDLNIEWLITGKGKMLIVYNQASQPVHVAGEPISGYTGPPAECEKCKMKDEMIDILRQQVETQNKLINHLEESKSPEYGQKRKAV